MTSTDLEPSKPTPLSLMFSVDGMTLTYRDASGKAQSWNVGAEWQAGRDADNRTDLNG